MIFKNIASQVQEECGKTLMANVKQKLRLIGRQGVLSIFKYMDKIVTLLFVFM